MTRNDELATISASHGIGIDHHSWTLPQSPSSHQQQLKTYESICLTESYRRDMCTVRSLAKVLELHQRLNVGGVFLVIVIPTYATLN